MVKFINKVNIYLLLMCIFVLLWFLIKIFQNKKSPRKKVNENEIEFEILHFWNFSEMSLERNECLGQ